MKMRNDDSTVDVFFSYDFFPKIGGAHFWLYKVAYYWKKPCIFLTSKMSEFKEKAQTFDSNNHGAISDIKRLPFRFPGGLDKAFLQNFFILFRFFSSLKRENNQIVCHTVRCFPEKANLLWLKSLLKRKIFFVTYAHGEEFLVANSSRQLKWFTKKSLESSDLIIANSFSTARLVKDFWGKYSKEKIFVIHLGVDFELYQLSKKLRSNFRRSWNFPEEAVVLITIARIEPHKNHKNVIKAIADLHKEGIPIAYVIGGKGKEEKELKELVERFGLKHWVRFVGPISEEEKVKSLCAADIFIMPSIQHGSVTEGFGIVFMEAAAAGLPSIAGNVGGQREAVIHGETGLVVDGTNLQEIKQAIKKLALDKKLRRNMGKKALSWAKKHDWKKISHKIYDEVYGNLP